jgi:Zn-dependent M28 family amino/carboxypeptidase
VLLEGAPLSQPLIDELAAAAGTYTSLTVQTSLHPFNSDHVPFIEASIPAVLTIEGTDGANHNIHTAGDTLDHIDYDLALQVVRMNVATTASALAEARLLISRYRFRPSVTVPARWVLPRAPRPRGVGGPPG